jgi:hypothetical protein
MSNSSFLKFNIPSSKEEQETFAINGNLLSNLLNTAYSTQAIAYCIDVLGCAAIIYAAIERFALSFAVAATISGVPSAIIMLAMHTLLRVSLTANLFAFFNKKDKVKANWAVTFLSVILILVSVTLSYWATPIVIASVFNEKTIVTAPDYAAMEKDAEASIKEVEQRYKASAPSQVLTNSKIIAAQNRMADVTARDKAGEGDDAYVNKKVNNEKAVIAVETNLLNRDFLSESKKRDKDKSDEIAAIQKTRDEAISRAKTMYERKKQEGDELNKKYTKYTHPILAGLYGLFLLTLGIGISLSVQCGMTPVKDFHAVDAMGGIWAQFMAATKDGIFAQSIRVITLWHKFVRQGTQEIELYDMTKTFKKGSYLSKEQDLEDMLLGKDKGGSDSSSQGGGSSPKPTPTTPPQAGAPEGGSNPLSRPAQAAKKEAAPTAEAVAEAKARARMQTTFADLEEDTAEYKEVFNGLYQDYLFPERKAAKEQAAIEKGLYKPSIGIPNPIAECSFPTLPKVAKTVDNERATPDETPSPTTENNDVVIELDVPRRGEAKIAEESRKMAQGDDALKYRSGAIARYHSHWNTDRTNLSVYQVYEKNLDAVLQMFLDAQYDYSPKVLAWFLERLNLWESHLTQNGFQYLRMDTIRGYIAEYQVK